MSTSMPEVIEHILRMLAWAAMHWIQRYYHVSRCVAALIIFALIANNSPSFICRFTSLRTQRPARAQSPILRICDSGRFREEPPTQNL